MSCRPRGMLSSRETRPSRRLSPIAILINCYRLASGKALGYWASLITCTSLVTFVALARPATRCAALPHRRCPAGLLTMDGRLTHGSPVITQTPARPSGYFRRGTVTTATFSVGTVPGRPAGLPGFSGGRKRNDDARSAGKFRTSTPPHFNAASLQRRLLRVTRH
jgi:hypothetical protein